MRWTNLESIKWSEVSQKEKNKYRILMHIYGILKDGTGKPTCRIAMEAQIQRTDLWASGGGVEGEPGMYRVIWKHTGPHVK